MLKISSLRFYLYNKIVLCKTIIPHVLIQVIDFLEYMYATRFAIIISENRQGQDRQKGKPIIYYVAQEFKSQQLHYSQIRTTMEN